MQKLTLLLILLSFSKCANSQVDSNSYKKKIEIDKKSINIIGGGGLQKTLFGEIGIAHARFQGGGGDLVHYGYYTSYERNFQTKKFNPLNGIKAGAYFAGLGGWYMTELKYQWFQEKHDWVITPKIGIGLGGMIMLNYGYNISLNNRPFEQVGKHQISLLFNFPIWQYKKIK